MGGMRMVVESINWQISANGLGVVYETRDGPVEALVDFSFAAEPGSFTTIVGPSGCGKSTLLRVIGGLTKPSSGGVQFKTDNGLSGGKNLYGMMFQRPVLLPWLTVIDNVLLPIKVFGYKVDDYRDKAVELLKMVGLDDFLKKYPYELSGGMQQRVAIARSLVFDPQVLLMDEPFSALDAITREQLNDQLQRLWLQTGKTVIFVTHSVNEAVFLGTSCIVMTERPGRIAKIVNIDVPMPRLSKQIQGDLADYILQVRRALEGGTGADDIAENK